MKYRNISPRLLLFIQHLKAQCEKALKLPKKGKEREESLKSIGVADGMLHSYWYVFSDSSSLHTYPLIYHVHKANCFGESGIRVSLSAGRKT